PCQPGPGERRRRSRSPSDQPRVGARVGSGPRAGIARAAPSARLARRASRTAGACAPMTSPAPDFDRREAWVDLLARLTDGFVRSIPPGGSPAAARLPGAPADDPVPAIEGFAR